MRPWIVHLSPGLYEEMLSTGFFLFFALLSRLCLFFREHYGDQFCEISLNLDSGPGNFV